MELLTNIITGYLKHNKRLVVPRFGAFIVKQPEGKMIFSELMRTDDGVLISLLVAYGCNALAANGMIDRFAFQIRHKVSQGERYFVPELGEFYAGENNTICFKQRREPKIYAGTIKPPLEYFDLEKVKQQRIQRIRQQQSENITGHSTHRRIKSSQTITPNRNRAEEEEELILGKPDKYLRGLTYSNRKNRNDDEDHYGSDRKRHNRGMRIVVMVIAAVMLSVGGWFTWRWLDRGNNSDVNIYEPADGVVVEPTDTLARPIEVTDDAHGANPAVAPTQLPATPLATPATKAASTSATVTPAAATTNNTAAINSPKAS